MLNGSQRVIALTATLATIVALTVTGTPVEAAAAAAGGLALGLVLPQIGGGK